MDLTSKQLYERARIDEVEREIVRMEQNGFALDTEYCVSQEGKARDEEKATLESLSRWCKDLGLQEVNWASPTQLVSLLHGEMGLPPSPIWKKGRVRIDQGERKLDETALEYIRNLPKTSNVHKQGIDNLIKLRRIRSAIKYLGKLPEYVAPDGLVHAVSGPASDSDTRAGTITWRLASKNPEILQISTNPKKDWYRVRRAFIAPPGFTLIMADEKALEAVIFAHILIKLFDDHTLAELLRPGSDLHAYNAKRVFGEYLGWERYGRRVDDFPDHCFKNEEEYPELCRLRDDIKAVWYGLMYGKTPYGFATSLRDSSDNPIGLKTAEQIVKALYFALPGIPRYQGFIADYLQEHHGVPGLGGAWCDLSELMLSGDKWAIAKANRIAQNYPCQEGGARIIGHAMVEIAADPVCVAAGLKLERQVHDELDFRIPLDSNRALVKERIRHHMTSYPLSSVLEVSIEEGMTWDG